MWTFDSDTDPGERLWFAGAGGALGYYDLQTERRRDYSKPQGNAGTFYSLTVAGDRGEEKFLVADGSGHVIPAHVSDDSTTDVAIDWETTPNAGNAGEAVAHDADGIRRAPTGYSVRNLSASRISPSSRKTHPRTSRQISPSRRSLSSRFAPSVLSVTVITGWTVNGPREAPCTRLSGKRPAWTPIASPNSPVRRYASENVTPDHRGVDGDDHVPAQRDVVEAEQHRPGERREHRGDPQRVPAVDDPLHEVA